MVEGTSLSVVEKSVGLLEPFGPGVRIERIWDVVRWVSYDDNAGEQTMFGIKRRRERDRMLEMLIAAIVKITDKATSAEHPDSHELFLELLDEMDQAVVGWHLEHKSRR